MAEESSRENLLNQIKEEKQDASDMRYYYTPTEYRERLEEDFEKRWANY